MAFLIRPSGQVLTLKPSNGKTFTLHELQAAVGGYIEAIPSINLNRGEFASFDTSAYDPKFSSIVTIDDRTYMIVNEEGKLKGMPHNEFATQLYRYGAVDHVVGDVLLLTIEEMEDKPDSETFSEEEP